MRKFIKTITTNETISHITLHRNENKCAKCINNYVSINTYFNLKQISRKKEKRKILLSAVRRCKADKLQIHLPKKLVTKIVILQKV